MIKMVFSSPIVVINISNIPFYNIGIIIIMMAEMAIILRGLATRMGILGEII